MILWRKDVWQKKRAVIFRGLIAVSGAPQGRQPLGTGFQSRIVGPRFRHTYRLTTMSYQNRGTGVSAKIYSLLSCLNTETYQEIVPKLEYWIEFAFSQQFTTAAKLAEHVSTMAWVVHISPTSLARFLKEFRDSPRRSAHARSFVNELCTQAFWWFTAASAEDLPMSWSYRHQVANGGGGGFMEAASFVGHLIECDLLNHKLVRQHLIKPLTIHYYPSPGTIQELVRSAAIFRLFVAAGNTLVQGLLEPDDARACFDVLETKLSNPDEIARLSTTKLEVQCIIHPDIPTRA